VVIKYEDYFRNYFKLLELHFYLLIAKVDFGTVKLENGLLARQEENHGVVPAEGRRKSLQCLGKYYNTLETNSE